MGQYRRSESEVHHCRRPRHATWLLAELGLLFLWCTVALAAPGPKADPKAKKADLSPEIMQQLEQVAEAQRSLAAEVAQLREQLTDAQRTESALRDETRQKHEASQSVVEQILDQVEGMRREVWGLYVEDSGLKNDIAQAGKQVDGLDQSLGSFRLSAGIVVAVVIVLQFVLVGLTFRGRG